MAPQVGKLAFWASFLLLSPVFAETIELVTYYPTTASTGNLHVTSLTVGTDYADETPGDGTALISGRLGIGTTIPAHPLEVYQPDECYVQIYGSGSQLVQDNFAGLNLGSDLPKDGLIDRVWQLAHKRGGAGAMNDFHINHFNGAQWSTPLAIQPNGNVGVGIRTPAVRLEVAPNSAIRLGNAYISSAEATGSAYLSANAWWDGTGWVYPEGARRSSTVALVDEQIGFSQRALGENWQLRFLLDTNGNIGLSTAAPQSAPAPNGAEAGNLDANDVWLRGANRWASQVASAPDYDSGWVADTGGSDHTTLFNHQFGAIPSRVEIWFAESADPVIAYPVHHDWAVGPTTNPAGIEASQTHVTLHISGSSQLFGIWRAGSGWTHFNSGFWRLRAWR